MVWALPCCDKPLWLFQENNENYALRIMPFGWLGFGLCVYRWRSWRRSFSFCTPMKDWLKIPNYAACRVFMHIHIYVYPYMVYTIYVAEMKLNLEKKLAKAESKYSLGFSGRLFGTLSVTIITELISFTSLVSTLSVYSCLFMYRGLQDCRNWRRSRRCRCSIFGVSRVVLMAKLEYRQ